MAVYWKSSWENEYLGIADWWPDYDVQNYFQAEWDNTNYARSMLYGLLTTCAIGKLRDDNFEFPFSHENGDEEYEARKYMSAISLLYTVRKPDHHNLRTDSYQLKFPPRYSHKNNKDEEDLTVPEVMKCFGRGGEVLPKIFPQIEVYDDVEHDYAAIVPLYLRDAVYVGIKGHIFTEQGLDFLKAILKEATQLEVLMLDNWGIDGVWETEFFDEFVAYLCSFPNFFSNFRLFKVLSSVSDLGFTVSRENFNNLITTYYSSPTDHMQKLHIYQAKVKCSDISFECSPEIDQRYLALKTIELDKCQFVSKYKATPQIISHWLGQGISELPRSDPRPRNPDAYYFKIGDEGGGLELPQKRKYSET